ncbi:MAG: hypothetical protein QXR48_02550 [Candidatus Woesearchaeota archaeon]
MAKKRQSPLEKSISDAWSNVPPHQKKKLVKVKDAILRQKNDVKRVRMLVEIVSNAPDAGSEFVRGTSLLSTAYISALASGFRRSHKNEYDILQGLAYAPKFVFNACAAVSAADDYYSALEAKSKQVMRIKSGIASLKKECRRARRLTVLEKNKVKIKRLEQRINSLKSSYKQLQKQYLKAGHRVKPVRSARAFYNTVHKNLKKKGKEIKALELRIASLDVAYNRLEDAYESAIRRIRRGTGRRNYASRAVPGRVQVRTRRRAPAVRPAPARRYRRRDTNLRRQYNEAQQELTRKQGEIESLTYRVSELTNDYERLKRTANEAAQKAAADLAEKDRKYTELQRDMRADVQRAQDEINRLNSVVIAGLQAEKQKLEEYIASLTEAHKEMQELYAQAEKILDDPNGAVEYYEKARKELQDHQDKFSDKKYEPFDVMIGLITRRIGDAYYCMARKADETTDANRVELYRKALATYEKAICDTETMARKADCMAQILAAPAQSPTPPPVLPGAGTPPPDAAAPPGPAASQQVPDIIPPREVRPPDEVSRPTEEPTDILIQEHF